MELKTGTILRVTLDEKEWAELTAQLPKFHTLPLIHPKQSLFPVVTKKRKLTAAFIDWTTFRHHVRDMPKDSQRIEKWLKKFLKIRMDLLNSYTGFYFELE